MKEFLGRLVISTLAVLVTSYILPGVHIDGAFTALLVALVLSGLNAIVKPVLVVLTIPITLFTLGFFLLVINAIMILFASKLVDGFRVDGFWTAFFFSLVLSLANSIFNSLNSPREYEL
ncbi:MAG: phage holin family protein [Bacteroidetes bacterium]|nr:phage holin family protein [Bacteroidota bacterium]